MINGQDIPIVKLKPLRERKIRQQEYDRIAASIQAVGLIEPLIVFPEQQDFVILNGYVRYRILLQLGVEVVPCIVREEKEAFTSNRMVNHLSPVQEARMLKKSLEELDEQTIASALAIKKISHRLNASLLKQLAPKVVAVFDAGKITKVCARDLTFVKPARQEEILKMMEHYNDFTSAFAQTIILKTPSSLRTKKSKGTKTPWDRSEQKKTDLLQKLKEAEEKHDFYSSLYRQYSINLLKLVIYVRSLITNQRIKDYLQQHHRAIAESFEQIIEHAEGS